MNGAVRADGRHIEAVIFDMDGVLTDTEVLAMEITSGFFRSQGVSLPEKTLLSTVGASGRLNWNNLREYVSFASDYETYISMYRDYADRFEVRFEEYLNPNVPELLAALSSRGYRIALASSTRLARIRQILDACGIAPYFEVVMSGEMFRESKPNPEIYLKTAERLGLPPARCVAVEDSPYGIASASGAGMTVIVKKERRFAIDQSGSPYGVDDLIEVLSVLEEIQQTPS